MTALSTREFYWQICKAHKQRSKRMLYAALSDYFERAPATVRAIADYIFFSDLLRNWWGGPLNGQSHRQLMVREIIASLNPVSIVETGTFRGTTTRFLANLTKSSVHTVESNRQYFLFAKWSLSAMKNVKITQLDSVSFLEKFAMENRSEEGTIFFYLDAHWYDYLPLRNELEIIFGTFNNAVVLIDDFEVPTDSGYTFDDYGPGKRLDLTYLAPVSKYDFLIYFPSLPSEQESGAKRGSVVLGKGPKVNSALSQLKSICSYGPSSAIPT